MADIQPVDPLLALADDSYCLGNCRVIPYRRIDTELFGDHTLNSLYDACVASRPSHPFGILPITFCGMLDLSRDAICMYLAGRQINLLCTDQATAPVSSRDTYGTVPALKDGTIICGFSFITAFQGAPANVPGPLSLPPIPQPLGERSALAAYVFFRPWWGTPEITVLAMLTAAYYFQVYRLSALHGQSYEYNTITSRFLSKIGAKTIGTVPRFLADREGGRVDGKVILSGCMITTLLREDFAAFVSSQLRSLIP